jgi:hypothetical protein
VVGKTEQVWTRKGCDLTSKNAIVNTVGHRKYTDIRHFNE